MDTDALEKLVKQGEGLQLEFKKFLPEPARLIREAIAFANTRGGIILLGVDDDGSLTGIKDVEEGAEVFRHAADSLCRPAIQFEMSQIALNRKRSVLVIRIYESEQKPVLLNNSGEEKNQGFFRVKDRSIQASKELLAILKHRSKPTGIKIEIGEKEKKLLHYLDECGTITLKEFTELAHISRQTASRTLIHLVKGNVLAIEPQEEEDIYYAIHEEVK